MNFANFKTSSLFLTIVRQLFWKFNFKFREAVAEKCFVKKVLLKISQNSQKNNCVGTSFVIKLLDTGVFL